ncbi:MAG: 2-hydroxyglutaryl-CoA dehydratase [Anaerolineae bacterium]|nr:2-hydroxyglutaryl-CoA dehydratase [Anaerolineae bacterium]NIN98063.1 2-hydroxyglutaryl-CoA dehydratase [Anaerolineae bacterium]NIQ81006.1 2-hydroxyglutaryl-CoA dehydratase [Anaerolineae bacterium]
MSIGGSLWYHWNVNVLGRAALGWARWQGERRARSGVGWKSEVLARPLRISPRTKELVGRHYLKGRYANLHEKVAWVTSGAPVEFLVALGYYVLYPENHAAICGTVRVAEDLASEAEDAGYSRDICSYARTDIGSVLSGKTPVGSLPRPDLLLACTNICQTVLYWYRVLAHHFEVPLILIDTPFVYSEVTGHDLAFVRRQLEEAIPVAEEVAGTSLDAGKLEEVGRLSKTAAELWMTILERCQHRPAPISVFDQFIHMGPIVEMRGVPATVDFYAAMLEEVDERISAGVAAVKEERRRLLWDNLPIWYRMRWLGEFLGQHGIVIAASTYTNAWGELHHLIDPARPIESMSRTYIHPILNRGTGDKLTTMRRMLEDYHLDGVILHSDRSCKPYSVGQMGQRDKLIKEDGVPALLLEADHNDPRAFSEEQAANRLDAFVEMLGV